MDKKKININFLFLISFILMSMSLYSQDIFSNELKWQVCDSTEIIIVKSRNNIVEWSKNKLPFATVIIKDILIKNENICIAVVYGCSGLPCVNIYIFKKELECWKLKTFTNGIIDGQIKIEINIEKKELIFTTKSKQIGELPFELLEICDSTGMR